MITPSGSIALAVGIALGVHAVAAQGASLKVPASLDHLVYATPDLDRGVREIETLLGIRATPGGQHPGRGTRNALIALGPTSYMEIIGPDPDQPPPPGPRPFGLDGITAPRLVTWASKTTDVERRLRDALASGIALGGVRTGSRRRPDGSLLAWRLTESPNLVADGLVPFFIDWGDSPHPAQSAAPGARLVGLRAEHPDEDRVGRMLRALGLDLTVDHGSRPALIATIDCPRGRVELR